MLNTIVKTPLRSDYYTRERFKTYLLVKMALLSFLYLNALQTMS